MLLQRLPPLSPTRLLEALHDARASGLDDTQLPVISVHVASGAVFRGRLLGLEPTAGLLLTSDSRNREAHVLYFDPAHVTAVQVEDAGKFESILSLRRAGKEEIPAAGVRQDREG